MIGQGHERDDDLELLNELIEASLRENGYEVTRYEDTNYSTTAYRGLFIKARNGRVFKVSMDEKRNS
ncbi:hypothetical protein EMIT07CA2_30045 [Brevibacillus sp. IT-7CA2]